MTLTEPGNADSRKAQPVLLDDEQPRNVALDRSLTVVLRFGHLDTEEEDSEGRNGTEAKRKPPYPDEVLITENLVEDQCYQRGSNEAEVDHRVRRKNEVELLTTRIDVLGLGVLGCGHTACWIFCTNCNALEEAVCLESGKEPANAASRTPGARDENGEQCEPERGEDHSKFTSCVAIIHQLREVKYVF